MKTVKDYIRTIPDFPHAGIMFRDVTTLFDDPDGFQLAIKQLVAPFDTLEQSAVQLLRSRPNEALTTS